MTNIPFFQVDAFVSSGSLTGNQAAVMPLDRWLTDELLQAIAAENNLAETAFVVPAEREDVDYELRWFTPAAEVPLCGHATLAAGHVLIRADQVRFGTKSGVLTVTRRGDLLELDLPAARPKQSDEPELCAALGLSPRPVWLTAPEFNDSAIVPLENEDEVRAVKPDFARLKMVPKMAIVTAPGNEQDIASRVFVPYVGIDEDPVTGSAHAALVPFWADRLGRESFTALQASKRGGLLECRLSGDRVILGGRCATTIVGTFQL
jgi:PhzF family phenazine biosynthesis protein